MKNAIKHPTNRINHSEIVLIYFDIWRKVAELWFEFYSDWNALHSQKSVLQSQCAECKIRILLKHHRSLTRNLYGNIIKFM